MDDLDAATLADRELEERRDDDRRLRALYLRERRAERASDEARTLSLWSDL